MKNDSGFEADLQRRVAEALATFTIDDLRELVREIEDIPLSLVHKWDGPANDNQKRWPYIPLPG
jgi:hypothetical protein